MTSLASKFSLGTFCLSFLFSGALCAGQKEAESIKSEYTAKIEAWSSTLKMMTSPELRLKAMEMKPNSGLYAKRLWLEIRNHLKEEWALPYITWVLPQLPSVDPQAMPAVRKVLEEDHLFSGEIGKTMISLSSISGPESLKLLEKVKEKNPDPIVKGETSLAIALLLAPVGSGSQVVKRRLTELREAILKSAESEVGDSTVGDIAAEEIYKIKNLMKGRKAPNLTGADQTGASFSLSDYEGKVVILTFWSGVTPQAEKTIRLLNEKKQKLSAEGVEVIGVNNDSLDVLRKLTGAGAVTWRNFSDPEAKLSHLYRVESLPVSYVLNRKGEIVYSGSPGSFVEMAALGSVNENAKIDLIRLE